MNWMQKMAPQQEVARHSWVSSHIFEKDPLYLCVSFKLEDVDPVGLSARYIRHSNTLRYTTMTLTWTFCSRRKHISGSHGITKGSRALGEGSNSWKWSSLQFLSKNQWSKECVGFGVKDPTTFICIPWSSKIRWNMMKLWCHRPPGINSHLCDPKSWVHCAGPKISTPSVASASTPCIKTV